MSIVNTLSLESNRKIKTNFNGGDLSSNAGLLLIKDFVSKLGIDKLFSKSFKTNNSALFRYHTDKENLLQMKIGSNHSCFFKMFFKYPCCNKCSYASKNKSYQAKSYCPRNFKIR